MTAQQFTEQLRCLGKKILPRGASLWLYGSRARGDARADSDWDLLVLLDKEKRGPEDNIYAEQLQDYGFDQNQYVSPYTYTRNEWAKMYFMPYVKNVEQDKIVLV